MLLAVKSLLANKEDLRSIFITFISTKVHIKNKAYQTINQQINQLIKWNNKMNKISCIRHDYENLFNTNRILLQSFIFSYNELFK